ncbi:HNH endonuclease [TM7 phage DolZOral124_53_65]|nr:HNH endonuclease [TM7 phage DolZOral124_53_65]
MTKIVAAAIKMDGIVFTGTRHHRIVQDLVILGLIRDMTDSRITEDMMGFIDSSGEFIDAKTALQTAIQANQIHAKRGELQPEDLWEDNTLS